MLDHYYSTESPLPADITQLCRIARATTRAEKAAVQRVASLFFVLRDANLVQKRVEVELLEYRRIRQRNSVNGRCGGRPKKNPVETQSVNFGFDLGNPNESEANNHTPVPITSPKGEENVRAVPKKAKKPTVDKEAVARLYDAYPRKVSKPDALKAIAAALETTDEKTIMESLSFWKTIWQADEVELRFIPHPGTWFRRREWENALPQPLLATPSVPDAPAESFEQFAEEEELRAARMRDAIENPGKYGGDYE